jgi:hypothetical protein
MLFQFNPDFPDATNEQKLEQVRSWRNVELKNTDWTQLPDSPVDKDAWATYRQALRDLPESAETADEIEIPVKP